MVKRLFSVALVIIMFISTPVYACWPWSSSTADMDGLAVVVPEIQKHTVDFATDSEKQIARLVAAVYRFAAHERPLLASGIVGAVVVALLYGTNDDFRKKVRTVFGLHEKDECLPCVAGSKN